MPEPTMEHDSNILNLSSPVIAVVGPTASGKTSLAQQIALELDGEVISADSMQIYKGMNIGTGKLMSHEQQVPHHGFDLVDPGEPFSAALFQHFARQQLLDIDARGKQPLLCGGTGFYIRAALDGYEFPAGEQINNPIREHYNAYALEHGSQALWELLDQRDHASATLIAPNDSKRVVRAFELLEDGTSYAQQKENLSKLPQVVPSIFIGLSVEPARLNARIDERVDTMIADGWLNEVQELLDKGLRTGITSPQAIGYKELVSVIEGTISLEEAVQLIKTATHRYAKRQRTWFRKDARIHWVDANEPDMSTITKESLAIIDAGHRS